MVGSSKILTVSYGTFSCTLEGFDDSFSTMKAIAEYFRDLAADDRYFGAEPATPDADMLARIAQREVSQQVEARTENAGIVLTAGAAVSALEDAQDAESTPETDPAAAEPVAEAQTTDAVADEPTDEASADLMMPPAAEAPASRAFIAAHLESEDTYEEDEVAVEPTSDHSAASSVEHADADSVAAKLQRIRAVVGRNASKVVEDAPSASDDSLFVEPEFETEADVADEMALGVADLVAEDGSDDAASDDANSYQDTLEAELEADAAAAVDDEAEGAADKADAPVRARVIRMRRSEAIVPDADGVEDTQSDNDMADEADDLAEAVETNALVEEEDLGTSFDDLGVSAEAQEEAEQVADLSKLDGDELAEAAMATLEDSAQSTAPLSTLDDDAEADLQAELAALAGSEEPILSEEAPLDLGTQISDAVDEMSEAKDDDAADAVEATQSRSSRIPGSPDDDEGGMTRILSKTEEEMAAPETSRRRDAIAQLKAAVAATEADRELSRDASVADENDEAPFRDDLRQVVRPTRPIRPSSRAIDPSAAEPAPLKLVPSQRVDSTDQPAEEFAAHVPAASEAAGFAGFAEEMGAQDLADLLEAAAAYTSFVEGAEDFSRPQLMSKVKELGGTDYSREDGLRSFGTLLRQGRINKVRNGRFQISEQTRFNPERRAG